MAATLIEARKEAANYRIRLRQAEQERDKAFVVTGLVIAQMHGLTLDLQDSAAVQRARWIGQQVIGSLVAEA